MKKNVIIVGVILGLITLFFLNTSLFGKKTNTFSPTKPRQEKNAYNFILLGYGGGVHEGTYLTDTMMVVHIDIKTKRATLISVPRDLWVKLPTKSKVEFHQKINSVYQLSLFPKTYPDVKADDKLIVNVISNISGLTIDGYISVNFEGFTKVIDILGGIDVNVERSFTDPEYPIEGKEKDLCDKDIEELFKKSEPFLTPGFNPEQRNQQFKDDPKLEEFVKNATDSPELAFPCRYEKLEFQQGIVHMDGVTALKYARSRHSETDGGDFNRARRQQQVIEAVKNKVLSISLVTKIVPLINEYKNDVKIDIDQDIIKKFIGQANKVKEYKITTFVLTTSNVLKEAISADGQYILIPNEGMDNWKGIQKMINNIIASPSATLK